MVSTFTKIKLNLLLITAVLFANIGTAQIAIEVSVNSVTFAPSNITINVGDTVRWTNTGGSHNVNGTTATYPSNPESFGNAISNTWVYFYVFNTPGTYNYQCDVHVAAGMVGEIIVLSPTGIEDNLSQIDQANINIYPNPNQGKVNMDIGELKVVSINVFGVNGKLVYNAENINGPTYQFELNGAPGVYILELKTQGETQHYKLVKD